MYGPLLKKEWPFLCFLSNEDRDRNKFSESSGGVWFVFKAGGSHQMAGLKNQER
jgi:hypothetical protein